MRVMIHSKYHYVGYSWATPHISPSLNLPMGVAGT